MKRKWIGVVVLSAALIGGSTGAVLAGYRQGGGCGTMPRGTGMAAGVDGGRLAKILKLTGDQQAQIRAVLESERSRVAPLFDRMHENRRLLMQAAEAAKFDEDTVRSLASAQAGIETELTVSRIRAETQINALLTGEQREMRKLLRPERERMPLEGGE